MKLKIYKCALCGKITGIYNSDDVPKCCGKKMNILTAEDREASKEKHIPCVDEQKDEIVVTVGSVLHPMTLEHYIVAIFVETDRGFHVKYLQPTDEPRAKFKLSDEKFINAFAYCNLHGLWKK